MRNQSLRDLFSTCMRISFRLTIFGCCSSRSKEISLMAVEGTCALILANSTIFVFSIFELKSEFISKWKGSKTYPFLLRLQPYLLHGNNFSRFLAFSLVNNSIGPLTFTQGWLYSCKLRSCSEPRRTYFFYLQVVIHITHPVLIYPLQGIRI